MQFGVESVCIDFSLDTVFEWVAGDWMRDGVIETRVADKAVQRCVYSLGVHILRQTHTERMKRGSGRGCSEFVQ